MARGPGVLAVGGLGGGEGEASFEEAADGIVALFGFVWDMAVRLLMEIGAGGG